VKVADYNKRQWKIRILETKYGQFFLRNVAISETRKMAMSL
jgi:hypothetical protein